MRRTVLRELFAAFLRARRFGRHFRRLALFESLTGTQVSRELPPALAQELIAAATSDVEGLLARLETNADGLSDIRAAQVREHVGLNEVEHEKPLPWWVHLWHCYRTPFSLLLTVLAVVSYLTEDLKATIVIGSMVVLATLVRFVQERKSNQAADKLKAMVSTTATVLRRDVARGSRRGGSSRLSSSAASEGSSARRAAHQDAGARRCDRAVGRRHDSGGLPRAVRAGPVHEPVGDDRGIAAGGEVRSAAQSDTRPTRWNWTTSCSWAPTWSPARPPPSQSTTGNHTYFGALAQRVTTTDRAPTHFQAGVNQVAWLLIRFMFVMAPLVLFINGITKHDWLEALLFALSIAVGLTPEMLPMIVTSTLAKGAVMLSRHKVIVKRLDAIQNFGAMDVLCTDKTGTLTQDKIVLARHTDVWGEESDDVLEFAYLNSYYQTGLKNLLDVAVLEHAEVHKELEVASAFRMVDEIPFDFQRRRMSVVVAEHDEHHLLICKGAVEEILDALQPSASRRDR